MTCNTIITIFSTYSSGDLGPQLRLQERAFVWLVWLGLKKEDALPILNGSRLSVWCDPLSVKARLNRHEIVLDVLWQDFEAKNFYFKLNWNVNRAEDVDDDVELRVLGWHIRDKLWPVPKHGSVFYVHRNHLAHWDGKPRTATSTFTQLLNSAEDVPLVKFMYRVFTRMPGESYRRRFRSLLLYLCYVFRALINSLVCWSLNELVWDTIQHFTNSVGNEIGTDTDNFRPYIHPGIFVCGVCLLLLLLFGFSVCSDQAACKFIINIFIQPYFKWLLLINFFSILGPPSWSTTPKQTGLLFPWVLCCLKCHLSAHTHTHTHTQKPGGQRSLPLKLSGTNNPFLCAMRFLTIPSNLPWKPFFSKMFPSVPLPWDCLCVFVCVCVCVHACVRVCVCCMHWMLKIRTFRKCVSAQCLCRLGASAVDKSTHYYCYLVLASFAGQTCI